MKRLVPWPLAVHLRALALGFMVAWSSACQDSYSVNGVDVRLHVRLDSIVVVAIQALDSTEAENLVTPALSGAQAVRRLSERGWILGIDRTSRREIRSGILQIMADPSVRWAGFMVRTEATLEAAFVSDEFITRFESGITRVEIDAMNQGHGVEIVHELGLRENQFLLRVTSQSNDDALRMANEYDSDPRTRYAHPNFIIETRPLSSPWPYENRYLAGDQWHLYNDSPPPPGDPRADIMAPEAWAAAVGDPSITIAVIEADGFDADHQDLINKLWQNPWEFGFSPGPGPFTAKTADLHGWNFEGCPSSMGGFTVFTDPCGSASLDSGVQDHGTQVAGVAAAETNNGVGVAGVCPGCSLMLIRMGPVTSEIKASTLAYAQHMGADVISISFTMSYTTPVMIDAVTDAILDGLTIVAGTDPVFCTPSTCSTPIQLCSAHKLYSHDSVIAVLASTRDDLKIGWSEGACLDIMAPGEGIWTTSPADTYAAVMGTSFATPVVSGVVGLLLSKNPQLTPLQIYEAITQTAAKVGGPEPYGAITNRNDQYGYGRINAFEALNAIPGGIGFPDATVVNMINPPAAVVTTTNASLTFTIQGEVSDPEGFSWVGVALRDDVAADGCDINDPLVPHGSGPGEMLQPNPIDKTGSTSISEDVTIHNTGDGADQRLCFFIEGVDLPPFSNLETAVAATIVYWR